MERVDEYVEEALKMVEVLASGTVFQVRDFFTGLDWNSLLRLEKQTIGRKLRIIFKERQDIEVLPVKRRISFYKKI